MGRKALTIYRENLSAVLAEARAGEGHLADLYAETAARVRLAIVSRGESISAADLAAEIDEAFKSTLFRRVRTIKTSIEHAAKVGPKAARATFKATYEEGTTTAQVRTSRRALEQAADRIAGRVTVDNVALSTRIRKADRVIGEEMAGEIQKGLRTRKGILSIAKKIEKLDTYEAQLPKYLQEVEALARTGNLPDLKKLAKSYAARAARTLGEIQPNGTLKASSYSLRSATQKFLRDVQKAGTDGVDGVVKKYVTERAAYQARVIARHESVQAFRASYIENSKGKPGVYGYRWTLSPSRHKIPDECDLLANANQHGLGPGVFPADKVPMHPHTSCICSCVAQLDERHFERPASQRGTVPDDLRDRKSPDAVGWMIDNQGLAQKIVGPTRWAAFKEGVPILNHEGRPKLVRDIIPMMGRQAAE